MTPDQQWSESLFGVPKVDVDKLCEHDLGAGADPADHLTILPVGGLTERSMRQQCDVGQLAVVVIVDAVLVMDRKHFDTWQYTSFTIEDNSRGRTVFEGRRSTKTEPHTGARTYLLLHLKKS